MLRLIHIQLQAVKVTSADKQAQMSRTSILRMMKFKLMRIRSFKTNQKTTGKKLR